MYVFTNYDSETLNRLYVCRDIAEGDEEAMEALDVAIEAILSLRNRQEAGRV